MGKHQQSKERYARIVTKKEKLIVARKKNKTITNMKLLAILFVAEVILIASCETSKKVKEEVKPEVKKAVKPEETSKEVKEVKSEAEKVAKKSSLKERLQDIAKKAKRAKGYYSTSGWWNRRTTSYPDYDYGRTSQSPSDYNSGYTTDSTCDWSGCYCNWSSDCSGSLMCYDNRCSYRTTTPDYGWNDYTTMGYWDYSTARYVGSEEYRDEEEENERDEERINPRGKDTPDQPKSK